MAFVNRKTREIQLKIVYAGPARAGKSASLAWIHRRFPAAFSSRLVRVRAGEGRTVFFDFLALVLPLPSGMRLHVRLYTLPGDERFEEAAKLVLRGVDGILFVADASAMRKTNILALRRIESMLAATGRNLQRLPLVFQFNKYDLLASGSLLLPPATLAADLNRTLRRPCWAASAAQGKNLLAPFCKIITLCAAALEEQARRRIPDLPLEGFAAAVAESLEERFSEKSPPRRKPPRAPTGQAFYLIPIDRFEELLAQVQSGVSALERIAAVLRRKDPRQP